MNKSENRIRRLSPIALAMVMMSGASLPAQAAPGDPVAPAFRVLEDGAWQDLPAIARAPGGAFVVTWRNGLGGVKGRRFAANGAPLDDGFAISSPVQGVNYDVAPDVAIDAAGDFVVTWLRISRTEILVNTGIPQGRAFARRYSADGTAATAAFEVEAPNALTTHGVPKVAMNAQGEFAIAFEKKRALTTVPPIPVLFGAIVANLAEQQVVVQRFGADGAQRGAQLIAARRTNVAIGVVSPINVIPDLITNTRVAPDVDVAMDSDGDLAVAWGGQTFYRYDLGFGRDAHSTTIFARAYDRNGVARSLAQTVDNSLTRIGVTAAKSGPSVAMNGSGGFVVAWNESTHITGDGIDGLTPGTIYGRMYNPQGRAAGGAIVIGTSSDPTYSLMGATADLAGDFQLTWSGPLGITGRRYTPNGEALAAAFSVTADGEDPNIFNNRQPAIASDSAGNFAFAWSSATGIKARLYEGP